MVIFSICSIKTRFFTCLDYDIKIHGTFMYKTSNSDSFFKVRELALNDIFSIFPLAGYIKLMVYLKICQSMSQRMLNSAEILFFVLIARVSCFGAMYVSESMDLDS